MASLEGDNLVVFYYLSASEIWPVEMSGLEWDGRIRCGLIHNTNV
jgi:hypothetical protein